MPFEKWEYQTRLIYANIENEGAKQYLAKVYPGWKKPPKFTEVSMEPYLNELGVKGWELVHMEPVAGVGKDGDVYYAGQLSSFSNVYFCVFKRRIY